MKKLILAVSAFAVLASYSNIHAQQTDGGVKQAPVRQIEKKQVAPSSAAADPVDPKMKGPKGETIYTGPKGGKYYMNSDNQRQYVNSHVDKKLKGPKGETVFIGPNDGRYYFGAKGEKIYLSKDKQTDKPAPVKQGTVKKAETAPPQAK